MSTHIYLGFQDVVDFRDLDISNCPKIKQNTLVQLNILPSL